ncbi:MAG TPA: aminoacetone oxidase family FAD-binding enzyme, partial [Clostridiaceae bacterium]|nr:aminoacetone oxidase family FAD-binding enzyme [Clostridiaceae bacterium]
LKSDRVIICTGGKAGPEFGSDGSGFLLSKKFGHSIIEPFPALVQLKLNAKFLKAIQGVKFDGNVELVVDKKVIKREDGEILFTDYGISGPPVFQLSRKAGELIRDGKRVFIKVVLVDYISEDGLRSVLLKRYEEGNKKPVSLSFVGL